MSLQSVLPQKSLQITVDDGGTPVAGLREALEADWLCRQSRRSVRPELAIQVIRHLEPFGRSFRWITMGLPHLIIRFTDDAVHIGPLVSATGSPCHWCEALTLVEAQPDLPHINAAKYGTSPLSECTPVALLVSSIAAHLVRRWKAGSVDVHTTQIVLPVTQGLAAAAPHLVTIKTHPECGCSI